MLNTIARPSVIDEPIFVGLVGNTEKASTSDFRSAIDIKHSNILFLMKYNHASTMQVIQEDTFISLSNLVTCFQIPAPMSRGECSSWKIEKLTALRLC